MQEIKSMREKKIKLFSVCDPETGRTLTIVQTRKQVQAYIDTYTKIKHYSHFSMWCKLRDLNPDEDSSWHAYLMSCEINDKFLIKQGKVPISVLVASFRTACGCLPLGMPWEYEAETVEYRKSLPEDVQNTIEELENLDDATEEKVAELVNKVKNQLEDDAK